MRRRAFSLIELLVVIAIIGILAGIALPAFKSASYKARLKILRVKMFYQVRFNTMNNDQASEEDVNWVLTNTPQTFVEDEYIQHLVYPKKK